MELILEIYTSSENTLHIFQVRHKNLFTCYDICTYNLTRNALISMLQV